MGTNKASSQDFDPKQLILDKIKERGGWVNAHAHIDRAYILNEENFKLAYAQLQEKWDFPDKYKSNATVDDIYTNMSKALENMCEQGVQAIGTFIDVDPVIKDKAIQAAQRARDAFKGSIKIKFINQVIKGVLDPEARQWFDVGAQFVDIIGGLPEKDKGHEAEHLDVLFEAAKKNGNKMMHVHVDQFDLPDQRDTELLIDKTLEHGYEGKVVAVHSVSLAAQPIEYRQEMYTRMNRAGLMVVTCPDGWIDWRRRETLAVLHNAIAPVDELVPAGITVALGTDNIRDIYKPFVDGDMWTELKFLLETCHFYEIDDLADIASTNGLKVLGL